MYCTAASSFSEPSKPSIALAKPSLTLRSSYSPNAASRSSFEEYHLYNVVRDTLASAATSDKFSLLWPLRPRTAAVAARIRVRAVGSASEVVAESATVSAWMSVTVS